MGTATSMIQTMTRWLGYSESNGKFKQILDIYNNHKPLARSYAIRTSDEWCAATVTTATTTGSGNAVTAISASNGALTATKDITFATKQESLNHVVASKTQPSNQ